ncbi:universal stress protein [Desulfosarcina alkanivorans]|nr:universal stress protein [Desulfosarcina alkanivorans]
MMTQEIKRVLYATDLSDNSAYAFGYAINLAAKFDAEVVVLHVIDKTMESTQIMFAGYINYTPIEGDLEKRIALIHEDIRKRLKGFIDKNVAADPESAGKVVQIEISKGYPADEILKKADELHCDAIVMGTHGKGIVSRSFFGSVAKRVLRRVRKPVFVIPLPEE